MKENSYLECSFLANRDSSFLFAVCIGGDRFTSLCSCTVAEKNTQCPDLQSLPIPLEIGVFSKLGACYFYLGCDQQPRPAILQLPQPHTSGLK